MYGGVAIKNYSLAMRIELIERYLVYFLPVCNQVFANNMSVSTIGQHPWKGW
jgi:hypothetical protein